MSASLLVAGSPAGIKDVATVAIGIVEDDAVVRRGLAWRAGESVDFRRVAACGTGKKH